MLGLDHLGRRVEPQPFGMAAKIGDGHEQIERLAVGQQARADRRRRHRGERIEQHAGEARAPERRLEPARTDEMRELGADRSEEHTSELQSLMRISYAVFCLKKKKKTQLK